MLDITLNELIRRCSQCDKLISLVEHRDNWGYCEKCYNKGITKLLNNLPPGDHE